MNFHRNILPVSFISILLTACSTTSTNQNTTPGSRHIYGVDCSGTDVSMSICYDKAKNLCPDGYKVISKHDSSENQTNTQIVDTLSSNTTVIQDKKGMTIECR